MFIRAHHEEPKYPKRCPYCGIEFKSKRRNKISCGNKACEMLAISWREKKRYRIKVWRKTGNPVPLVQCLTEHERLYPSSPGPADALQLAILEAMIEQGQDSVTEAMFNAATMLQKGRTDENWQVCDKR